MLKEYIEKYLPEEFDDEINIDFRKILFAVKKRFLLFSFIFILCLSVFISLYFFLPYRYESETDLYINISNNTNLKEINPYSIDANSGSSGVDKAILNEIEIIKSPLVMQKVIEENDIRIKKLFGIITTKKTGKYVPVKKFIKKGFEFKTKRGTNIFSIRYVNRDRELAYNVVKSIIKNYEQVRKEINGQKAESDIKLIEEAYNNAKNQLDTATKNLRGLPENSLGTSGNLAAMSAFSRSAQTALSNISSKVNQNTRTHFELNEEANKVSSLASKLQWAKLVSLMSDSSNLLILKEPQLAEDYEQIYPKLTVQIVSGLFFGAILGLIAMLLAEIFDKKLTYTFLGSNIIYNIKNEILKLKLAVYTKELNTKNIIAVSFAEPTKVCKDSLNELFNNIEFVKPDVSQEFIRQIKSNDIVIFIESIGKTNIQDYRIIKQLIRSQKKKILYEILV